MADAAGARPTSDPTSPAGKAAFFAAVLPALVRTANAVERQAWLARVVERGGLDAGAAREELRRALQGRTGGTSAVAEAATRAAGACRGRRSCCRRSGGCWRSWRRARPASRSRSTSSRKSDLEGLRSAPLLRVAQAVARETRA